MIDDKNEDRFFGRFKLQTKLLLDSGKDGRPGAAIHRNAKAPRPLVVARHLCVDGCHQAHKQVAVESESTDPSANRLWHHRLVVHGAIPPPTGTLRA